MSISRFSPTSSFLIFRESLTLSFFLSSALLLLLLLLLLFLFFSLACSLLKLFMVHIPIYKFHKNTLEELPVSSHSQISQKDTWGFVQFASHSQISHKTCWNFPVSRTWLKSIISPSTTTQKRTAIFPSLYLIFSMELFFMMWVLSASELFFFLAVQKFVFLELQYLS